ncbi:aryl-alcohol-oxidase from pleurotus Eryingii [Mycena sp. CBHHK59/15]|nr:aryl-alcohol-oxidase from pleurotus Eryingii [Mycena sp. CBHHK59/15]
MYYYSLDSVLSTINCVFHLPFHVNAFTVASAFFASVAEVLYANAKLYANAGDLPRSEYDFVVIGAGNAGNVIASRLSENPEYTICVIEAGGNDAGIMELMIPFTASEALSSASLVWDYATIPQDGLDGRTVGIQRGRVLGGSSSINLLAWTRGARDDFDRIARITEEPAWSWDAMFPYMLKTENFTQPVDHHNTSGEFNTSAHGNQGPLLTTLAGYPSHLDALILGSTTTNPSQFPFNLDMNAGDTIGIGWLQSNAGGGQRSSSATAYLHPVLDRPNLDVLINTQVTRLLDVRNGRSDVPDLRVVEFADIATRKLTTIRASKEVIVSAGAINTPQILMLSGVGDAKDLSALGIDTIVDSPGVGQNLQDHPLVPRQWFANTSISSTFDGISKNATLGEDLLEQWENNRTGQFVDIGSNLIGWFRLPSNSSLFDDFEDPSAGPTAAHIELFPFNAFFSFLAPVPDNGSFFSIVTNVVSPASRRRYSTVTLNSTDPFDFPLIDPSYLTHPLDVDVAIAALKMAEDFVATSPWKDYIIQPFGVLANATTDEDIAAYARSQVTSFWHPCCTAKMGTAVDPTSVVDADLRLKGTIGVRIVDASVFVRQFMLDLCAAGR